MWILPYSFATLAQELSQVKRRSSPDEPATFFIHTTNCCGTFVIACQNRGDTPSPWGHHSIHCEVSWAKSVFVFMCICICVVLVFVFVMYFYLYMCCTCICTHDFHMSCHIYCILSSCSWVVYVMTCEWAACYNACTLALSTPYLRTSS